MKMGKLDGKIALVTGAASGIGETTSRLLAAEGAQVILTDVDTEKGKGLAEELNAQGTKSLFFRLDVTSSDEWKTVVDKIIEECGGLDILVNNAGVEVVKSIEETTTKELDFVIDVNLKGVYYGTQFAVKAMKERAKASQFGGSIINLSSVGGFIGAPFQAAYCMTKGGVRLFTKSAALEFAALGYNIRVNSVHPGGVTTAMTDYIFSEMSNLGAVGSADEARKGTAAAHPIGRMATTDDIAKPILFLASDDSGYMTGSELVVDGGFLAQ